MSHHPDSIRLNKALSESGYCSRREADKLIEQGRVAVNGTKSTLGDRVLPNDTITVDGTPVKATEKQIYLAFHKPVGIVCTTDQRQEDNIIDYINYPERIFPIGRLDKPSEGLILLTNDGDIVNKILRGGNNHDKEYIVGVDRPITENFLKRMRQGVPILDTVTKKCVVEEIDRFTFKIVLTQGLNRQIRRMCEYLGYDVTSLKRVRIMNIRLDDLAVGQWRPLNSVELQKLNELLKDSSKTIRHTPKASPKRKRRP